MNAPIRIKDPNSSGRQYNFNLTFGGMAVLLSALTLALTLFFILGVLVGRGHRPETAVPVVAGMMPKEPMARPVQDVLKAEDLNYSEQLGPKHDGPAPARTIDKAEHKSGDKKPEKPAEKTEAKKDPKKDAKADAKKAEKLADKKAAEKKPDPDTQRYDYAYQAATFPDADSAKAFLKRAKGMGLKGDIETGTTNGKAWHRVVIFFQGTPTDTRSLKEKLSTLGAQKLVMRSKAPI
jgi:cell division septation protein DedD